MARQLVGTTKEEESNLPTKSYKGKEQEHQGRETVEERGLNFIPKLSAVMPRKWQRTMHRRKKILHSLLSLCILRLLSLYPLPTLLCSLLNGLLVHFFHSVWTRHMPSFLHCWPLQHPILPLLQMREFRHINACVACGRNPSPMRDVGDGAFVADKVS